MKHRWALGIVLVLAVIGCGQHAPRSSSDDDDGGTAGPTTTSGGGGTSGSATSGSGASTSGVGGAASELLPGDLVITEIMNNPAVVLDESGEWFEIHNTTNRALDLAGILIRHQADTAIAPHVIGELIVPPQGYAVLGCNGDPAVNGGITMDYVYGSEVSLHNASDHLAIETDVVIDATNWDEASGFDPSGSSRTLDPQFMAADANDDDTHFCAASTLIDGSTDYGTPGAANDVCP